MGFTDICCITGLAVLYFVVTVFSSLTNKLSAQRFARLERQAAKRGWEYQSGRESYGRNFSFTDTTNNVPWRLEVGGHNFGLGPENDYQGYTHWRTDAIRLSDEVVLLFSKAGRMGRLLERKWVFDKAVNELLANQYVADNIPKNDKEISDFRQACHNVWQVQAGSDELRKHYFVIAHNETTANRFLNQDAELMLLDLAAKNWSYPRKPRNVAVIYWHKGLQFISQNRIMDINGLEQFVQLGLALVSGQKPSGQS